MNSKQILGTFLTLATLLNEDGTISTPPPPDPWRERRSNPWYRVHLTKKERVGKTQPQLDTLRREKYEASINPPTP